MIKKFAITKYELSDLSLLNKPQIPVYFKDQLLDYNESSYNETVSLIKKAHNINAETVKDGDSNDFDLEAEIKSNPDSLFVKCFAIKADEPNDNGDYFSKDELKKSVSTFVGVPVFTNHNNTDVENSRGKVIYSWWDEDRNGIMIIERVDAEAYPQLARGIKSKYIYSTSMGCSVQYSLCSICHNHSVTPNDYCNHIKERKTRKLSEKNVKCKYHKNGTLEKCPLCDSTKNSAKTFSVEDKLAFEHNYGIKFIENSFVVNPACHSCGVTEVIDPQEFLKKVAAIQQNLPGLLKAASKHAIFCTDKQCVKYAGQKEIQDLNQAVDLLASVSKSMLDQKNQIDLEFLSDLVKVLSDLQAVKDELTQQGYGRLQSTPDQEGQPSASPTTQPPPMAGEVTNAVPVNPTPDGFSRVETGKAGDVGSVTMPTASHKINLEKYASALLNTRKQIKLIKILNDENNEKQKKLSINFSIPKSSV